MENRTKLKTNILITIIITVMLITLAIMLNGMRPQVKHYDYCVIPDYRNVIDADITVHKDYTVLEGLRYTDDTDRFEIVVYNSDMIACWND